MATLAQLEQQQSLELSNQDIFEILKRADSQYEAYVEITRYDFQSSIDDADGDIKRDINHPLNIVVR